MVRRARVRLPSSPEHLRRTRVCAAQNPYLAHLATDEGETDADELLPLRSLSTVFGRSTALADVMVRDESVSRQVSRTDRFGTPRRRPNWARLAMCAMGMRWGRPTERLVASELVWL